MRRRQRVFISSNWPGNSRRQARDVTGAGVALTIQDTDTRRPTDDRPKTAEREIETRLDRRDDDN